MNALAFAAQAAQAAGSSWGERSEVQEVAL